MKMIEKILISKPMWVSNFFLTVLFIPGILALFFPLITLKLVGILWIIHLPMIVYFMRGRDDKIAEGDFVNTVLLGFCTFLTLLGAFLHFFATQPDKIRSWIIILIVLYCVVPSICKFTGSCWDHVFYTKYNSETNALYQLRIQLNGLEEVRGGGKSSRIKAAIAETALRDKIFSLEKSMGLRKTKIFRQGRMAAKAGISLENNPYDDQTFLREWRDGWLTEMERRTYDSSKA